MRPDYVCATCGAAGCKLWREYQTFAPQLLCARCAAADQGKDISLIDRGGSYPRYYDGQPMGRTDQIGWYVPAVPTVEGDAYWGYTSIPPADAAWWRALPTLPALASSATNEQTEPSGDRALLPE